MYHDFYQLKENPFNVTADPEYFYESQSHREAVLNLTYGIEERKGIMVVTGEVGTGKTTLCRKIIRQADKKIKIAFILNPHFGEVELLQLIIQDLGLWTLERNRIGLIRVLNKFLIKSANANHNVVLLIDEAQNLSVEQLEQIRLLSNLETEKEKLLQIILVGQPELDNKLQLTELRQLRQRVAIYLNIKPLNKSDIKTYIQHRINLSLRKSKKMKTRNIIFTEKALDKIYQFTQGTPRKMNILCDRALLSGYVSETYVIDEAIIEDCAKEVLYCEYYL